MDKDRLLPIIERIADNTATEEDIRIYNAWCNAMQEQEWEVEDIAAVQKQTLKNIQDRITHKQRKVILWRSAAAAAVIAGVLGTGLYIYRDKGAQPISQVTHPATVAPRNDIPSGSNRATLTLANGSKITLANAQNGLLTKQAGVEVTKTSDDNISYSAVSSGASATNTYNTLHTARGEQYKITLADGTQVWLNAATTLKFPASFAKNAPRKVEVNGEAYFEVAPNAAQPFLVHTDKQEIIVLGTHFNVNNYADEPSSKTTLLEGAIKINDKLLKPGQQAVSGKDGSFKIAAVAANAVVAWKNGYFEFNDENIYDIMRKMARWYDVEVIYEGNIPLNTMEGTISRFENVSKVLNTIQKTGLLKFRIEQKKIYVSTY